MILTGCWDKKARLWDAATGSPRGPPFQLDAPVQAVAFSPDGRTILTGCQDKTARLWDVDYHDAIRYLCGRLLRDFSDDERAQYGITNDEPTCPHS